MATRTYWVSAKERTGSEGRISVTKRRHGLRRCLYRGDDGMHRWVGLGIIAFTRGTMRLALPFGTFLAAGALAAMLVGEPLVAWYAGFFVP